MAFLRIDEATRCFHKMDDAIRKAAAARKRGDSERETFWLDEMRKFAKMHGKERLNASQGISEGEGTPTQEKAGITSSNYKISAVKRIRTRKKTSTP